MRSFADLLNRPDIAKARARVEGRQLVNPEDVQLAIEVVQTLALSGFTRGEIIKAMRGAEGLTDGQLKHRVDYARKLNSQGHRVGRKSQ